MRTLRTVIETSAQQYPHQIAIQLGDEQLTFRQLLDQVSQVAGHLENRGIQPGQTAVLLFENIPSCIVGFLALAWLQSCIVPLEPASIHELQSVLEGVPFTAVIGRPTALSRLNDSEYTLIDIEQLRTQPSQAPTQLKHREAPPNESFIYHFSSGSTGKPKAALHSQTNLINGGLIYKHTFQISSEDSILTAVPLVHSFGMVGALVTALLSGARLVLTERFIPNRLIAMLEKEKIGLLFAVPLMYDLMSRCYLPDTPNLNTLRICFSSGSRLLPEIKQRFQSRFHKTIYQVYGSTETGIIAAQRPDKRAWPQDSVGAPVMGVRVRIVNDKNQDLPANETGNLLVKTPAMFAGYLNYPDASDTLFIDGWYNTRDMAWQDEDGRLYLVGRKDTFINSGGKKVNPIQVEETLLAHPKVKQAMVFGVDAGNGSELVQAMVVPYAGLSEAELIAFCRERLAPHKVPHHIEFRAELPQTSLGKRRRSLPDGSNGIQPSGK